ncbi:four helix bundle protein [Nitrosococcus wardiae]|uniref:Four helix bundle protein n=1 Tax=Nitrosococcus wardiae TaxID=1814290 RepID=A0A4P7C1Y3_9GAMM|nr:four helix bundle protein [Nitrosococcus wardiae]
MSEVDVGHFCLFLEAPFKQFVVIVKGSCAEVRSQLFTALDVGYLTQNEHRELDEMASEVARIVGGLLASLRRGEGK